MNGCASSLQRSDASASIEHVSTGSAASVSALDRPSADPLSLLVRTCEGSEDAISFSGVITAVGTAPGAFSGSANAYQDVTYRLDSPSDLLLARGEWARDVVPPCDVTVSYEVQWSSPLVDHRAGGLDRELFRIGDHQIVGSTRGFRRWVAIDTWATPILATNQRVEDTRELLSERTKTD